MRHSLVEKLVRKHQGHHGHAKLAASLPRRNAIILLFEAIDVMQRQHNHTLTNLGRFQELLHELHERR